MQEYTTISGTAKAQIEEKKSVFIAVASFVNSEHAAAEFLQSVKSEHKTARHNVYAYVLNENNKEKYSDDGEPAKTAGLPTLQAIQHQNLQNCMVITTRYFGGTLLGTGGLVRAYTAAAKAALQQAKIVCMKECTQGTLNVDYAIYEQITRLLSENHAFVEDVNFTEDVKIIFLTQSANSELINYKISEMTKGKTKAQFSPPFYAAI